MGNKFSRGSKSKNAEKANGSATEEAEIQAGWHAETEEQPQKNEDSPAKTQSQPAAAAVDHGDSGNDSQKPQQTAVDSNSSKDIDNKKTDGTRSALTVGPSGLPLEHYMFPFENVVFEGGGTKCLAYCGAVRVLEEVGLWTKVRRLSGCSGGAVVAALLSVGFNSHQLQQFLTQDPHKLLLDHSCGYLSLLPSLLRSYGWNPGQRVYNWLGSRLREVTGKSDISFSEVQRMFGKDLCIVVTNLNQMCSEYCHAKTTPDMPIRVAVRMSMSLPGVYKPVRYKKDQHDDVYVDGSLLCSYPVHCFDGWWLSMETDDAFVKRIPSQRARKVDDEDRFGTFNSHTIGFLLYSEEEQEKYQTILDNPQKNALHDIPKTKLAKNHQEQSEARQKVATEQQEMATAVDKFLQALKAYRLDRTRSITRNDLQNALSKVRTLCKDGALTDEDLKLLFGEKVTPDDIFMQIDINKADQISYPELVGYLERKGLHLQSKYLAHKRQEIRSLVDYVLAVHETVQGESKLSHVKNRDGERTVGINTQYVSGRDWDLEKEDQDFLVQQGIKSTCAFLEGYVTKKLPPSGNGEGRHSFCRDDLSYFIDDEASEIIDERDYMENFIRGVL